MSNALSRVQGRCGRNPDAPRAEKKPCEFRVRSQDVQLEPAALNALRV